MNAQSKVEPPPKTLAHQMMSEGVHQVRYYPTADQFTVEMFDGRTGQGASIREAVDSATHERLAS